jgi:peptidyl-prolyl cis-trans isomerase SurA
MAMNGHLPDYFRSLGLAAAVLLPVALAPVPAAAQVVAMVYGQPITQNDIDQRAKFEQLSTQKTPTRQAVLDELINEILKVREAKRWGIDIPDADVETAYAGISNRMRVSPAQLTQNLAKSGVNANTLKARLRADAAWTQLVRGRYQSSLQISEKDVQTSLETQKSDEKDVVAFEYTMRPILFLVPPGSPDGVIQARRKDAEALRGRFKSCDEGIPMARGLRDVAVRDQIVRSSADLAPELRKLLDSVPVGTLTAPDLTRHGIEMFAICAKSESKADTPGRRQVRDAMFAKRYEELSTRYLRQIRASALIEYK